MTRTLRTLAVAPVLCLLLSGCRVSEHKNGGNDNVDIGTPFGSMHVKTNDSGDTSAIGLAAYPGAVPIKDDDDKNGSSADVNLSFGSFHLGVKAASFQTPDQPEKVLAFYRKDLAARYGEAIECRGHNAIGSPKRTSQGLTCDDSDNTQVSTGSTITVNPGIHIKGLRDSNENDLELRAGSPTHQHVVAIVAHDGGTKIGLVALDLPSHLSDHGSKDSE